MDVVVCPDSALDVVEIDQPFQWTRHLGCNVSSNA